MESKEGQISPEQASTKEREVLVLELAGRLHNSWRAPRWQESEKRFEPRLKPQSMRLG